MMKYSFVKKRDAWITVFFFDLFAIPLSIFVSKFVKILKPDHLTFLSVYVYVFALICLFYDYVGTALVLMFASTVLDCMDGKLARILMLKTIRGRYVDAGADFLIHSFGFLAVATWHYSNLNYLTAILVFIWGSYFGIMHINSMTMDASDDQDALRRGGPAAGMATTWDNFCSRHRLINRPVAEVEIAFIIIPLSILFPETNTGIIAGGTFLYIIFRGFVKFKGE